MSSVAVLTAESFAEHRSGLKDEEMAASLCSSGELGVFLQCGVLCFALADGVPADEAYIPTYLEAFPPLPEKGAPGETSGESGGAWSKIRPIKSSVITQKRKTTTISVEVKKSQHKYIIGPKGTTLQEILDATGVSVEMPPLDSGSETIVLRGEPDSLGPALTQVYAKVHIEFTDGEEKITLEGPTEEVEQAQALIQEMIKEMVIINFPDPAQKSDIVQLRGPKNEVEKCVKYLQRGIAELIENSFSISVPIFKQFHKNIIGKGGANIKKLLRMDYTEVRIDQRFHRHLIGKNGANINRMKEQYKVCVRVPQDVERSSLVRIEGELQGVQLARKELLELSARMENERTRDLIIEQRFHRTLIGQKGEKIKEVRDKFPEIREETNTKIDLPTENSNSEVIVITGKKPHCEAARDRILAIQRELANIKEAEVSIPARLHNSLIGAKGRLVRAVMEECGGAHIHFPAEGSGSDKVTIRGPVEEVERAKRQLLQLAEEKQINNYTVELQAKPEYHKFLIGRGGGNIRKVRDRTGARIIFPASEEKDLELITIVGKEEAVRLAQRELEELIKNLQINNYTVELQAKPEYHKFLIGRGGGNIRKVRDRTGARIIFPASEEKDLELITIVGKEEAVRLAQRELEELIKNLDNVIEDSMAVEPRYHRHFVLRRGQVLREIAEEYGGVTVSFPRTGVQSDRVTLKGAKDCVEAAKRRIQDIIQHLGHKVAHAGNRPHSLPLILILLIPLILTLILLELCLYFLSPAEQEEESPFQALVPVTVDVDVPFDLHRYIIGQKGAGIRKMMEEYEDLICITGYESSAEAARESIQRIVADLEEMVSEDVKLDHRVHARIIGGRGKAIRKLMDEFKVDIRFPQPGSDDPDRVTVTGLPEKVDNAIDHLLNLEEEYMMNVTETETMAAYMKPPSRHEDDIEVDIRFPQPGSDDPDRVTVTGLPEKVDNAIDHLLNLEEEYMMNVTETETMAAYMKPPSRHEDDHRGPAKGFVVRDAPWNVPGTKVSVDWTSRAGPSFLKLPIVKAQQSVTKHSESIVKHREVW
ncbi:UNVERIFIED_CONTAM: hypothetical protein FKN15_013883 [Acipenser sinensis]